MFQRKLLISLVLAACFVIVAGAGGPAAASGVSVGLEYWKPSVAGEVKATDTDVKLKDDLGFGKKGITGFMLSVDEDESLKYYLRYEGATFRATKNLPRSFGFAGGNYMAGDRVDSELKVNYFQVGLRNEKPTTGGKFSTIFSYTHGTVKTGISDLTRNFSRSRENSINALGLGFGWESANASGINFFAEATPLSLSRRGGCYNDYNFGIKAKISPEVGLTLGYRGERMGSDDSDSNKKVDLHGMYMFLNASF